MKILKQFKNYFFNKPMTDSELRDELLNDLHIKEFIDNLNGISSMGHIMYGVSFLDKAYDANKALFKNIKADENHIKRIIKSLCVGGVDRNEM